MKKLFTLIIAIAFAGSLCAQAPQKMSYQAVIRSAAGNLFINQNIGMQISILQGSASGSPVYVETQTGVTNANGLLSVEIGAGAVQSGNFSGIDWNNGPYFIKTETDPSGGTNYSITGSSELLSVPYALNAGNGQWFKTGNDISNVNAGRVGIGTQTPQQNLSVQEGMSIDQAGIGDGSLNTPSLSFGFASGEGIGSDRNGSGGNGSGLDFSTSYIKRMSITNVGNVGIGTLQPLERLEVAGAVQISGNGQTSDLNIVPFSTQGFDPATRIRSVDDGGYGAHLDFYTKPFGAISNVLEHRMRISNNGNVGIGTIIPSQKLEIDTINTTAFNSVRLNTTYDLFQTGSNSLGFELRVQDGGFSSYRMYPTGSYLRFAESSDGFATATDIIRMDPFTFEPVPDNVIPLGSSSHRWTEVWAVNGVIQTSDSRYKKSVRDIQYGLAELMKLKPVSYEWKNDKLKQGTGTNLGFIAQDLEKILPDVVVHTINKNEKETGAEPADKESYGVKYVELIPVLTKAIQEQQKIIQDQESRIQHLEKLISELEKK